MKRVIFLEHIFRLLILFGIGGFSYMGIEILWRGYTHWSMGIVGGLCFVLIGLINEIFTFQMPLWLQDGIAALLVTVIELISGVIINLILDLNIWDYSNMPFNILGQVCLLYTVLWFFLATLAIIVDDFLRWRLFHEEFPKYKII